MAFTPLSMLLTVASNHIQKDHWETFGCLPQDQPPDPGRAQQPACLREENITNPLKNGETNRQM